MSHSGHFIPALGHAALTPLYDPLLRWGMREAVFKRRLIERAALRPGQRVLDLGCGTGTLTLLIKQSQPGADVVGLDADPEVLASARSKAERAGVHLTLDQGFAHRLPYPDQSFDRVLSSLVFHHLERPDKAQALKEAWRVLRPHGSLLLLDFGPPHTPVGRMLAVFVRRLERAADNVNGLLPVLAREAGFTSVVETDRFMTIFGALALLEAVKAG